MLKVEIHLEISVPSDHLDVNQIVALSQEVQAQVGPALVAHLTTFWQLACASVHRTWSASFDVQYTISPTLPRAHRSQHSLSPTSPSP